MSFGLVKMVMLLIFLDQVMLVKNVQGTYMNALVAYVPPMDSGESMSRFGSFIIHRLDTIFA